MIGRILLNICLGLFVPIAILYYPRFLALKMNPQSEKSIKYLPQVIAISVSLPGTGFLIATLFRLIGHASLEIYFAAVLMFMLSALLLFLGTLGFYELILLCLEKWPDIQKSGSEYIVVPPLQERWTIPKNSSN